MPSLGVMAAYFSPDSKRIVTGSKDMSAKVWEAATGKELLTLEGHKGEVYAANFSPDGQRIITGSLDGTVRVWAAALPAQIAAWRQEALSGSNRLSASIARPMLMAGMQSFQPALRPGVIPRWLLLAPMDAPAIDKAEALEVEQIPGEARIRPRAGDRVRDQEKQWTWEAVEQTSPLLDFNVFVGMTSLPNGVAYAVCYLVSESPQSGLIFKIVSDDECKVYLNGQLIHRSNPNRDYVMEEEMVDGVELRAGTNTVVFKVLNATDKWLGWLRVLDASGQAAPNLHVTLEPD